MAFNEAIMTLPDDKLQFIIKNGRRKSEILGYELNPLTHCSFKFIKEILPELIKNGKFDELIFNLLKDRGFNIFEYELQKVSNEDKLSFICWIKDELESIYLLESTYLSSPPDNDMLAAGIQELNQFGDLNIIDTLANGDILKWEQIKMLRYDVIFDKQYKSVVENGIQKKLMNLKKSKK